jgi:hypothetical protein
MDRSFGGKIFVLCGSGDHTDTCAASEAIPPYERELDKPWLNAGIMAALVAALIFFFSSATQLQQKVDQNFPRAALEFMRQQHLDGRIFNQYGWGSFMIWNAPEFQTFIDGRGEVVSGTAADYGKAVLIQAPFQVLSKYKIDYVLLAPSQPLSYLLQHSPAWRPIYNDNVAVLFERTDPKQ